jgi:molybdenum cofactor cytidylyltransferase
MLGYAPEVVDRLRQPGRLVLVEADGSAHRPFKAPAEHEPVIPAGAADVVVCAGLQVLGRPLDERWVHRPELAAGLAGVAPGSPVTPWVAATVLLAPAGGRKGVPRGARCHALLNVAGEAAPGPEALELARRLADGGYDHVVIADARRGIVFEVMGRAMVSAPAADH